MQVACVESPRIVQGIRHKNTKLCHAFSVTHMRARHASCEWVELKLHEMREQHEQHNASKCLTFAREYVSMHVMEHSNAAFARGENDSSFGFGAPSGTTRRVFTGRDIRTAEAFEIAATEDAKFTAGAGFASAVN
jgi:nucleoid DNA-binding protein